MRTTAGSRALLALIACLTTAAPAVADVVPLAQVAGPADVGIAGDRVVLFETLESGVRVRSVPAGGGPETVLFEAAGGPGNELRMAGWASAERLAFVVIHDRAFEEEFRRELYAGPAGGPFEVIASGAWGQTTVPATADADGARVFWAGWGPDFSGAYRWSADEAGATRAVPVPGDVVGVDFAGDVAGAPVYGASPASAAQRYVVFDHRTGEQRLRVDVIDPQTHAVRSDGTAAIEADGLVVASPARPRPRRLRGSPDVVGFAGDRVVAVRSGAAAESVRALPVDGSRGRRVGPATRALVSVDAEEAGRVAWIANGCAAIAPASDPRVDALPPGPCPRAEAAVDSVARDVVLGRRRSIPVRLRCFAAPGSCRGRIELVPGTRRRAFSVRVGHTEAVRVPLSAPARRHLRREFRDGGGSGLIAVRATAIDPQGRTSESTAKLLVFRDVAARRRGP